MMQIPKKFRTWFDDWPELVCFDLDGTLVDSVPDISFAVDYSLRCVGAEPAGEDRVRGWIGLGATKLIEQAMLWAHIPDSQYQDFYRHFLLSYRDNLTRQSRLYPNVMSTLEALKRAGIPMALVTNKPGVFVAPLLKHLQIESFFAWQIAGDTLEEKKPSALPLLHCCETLDAKPEDCLMVGDSIVDHQAARAAGFRSVVVTYGYHHGVDLTSLEADALLDDLTELFL